MNIYDLNNSELSQEELSAYREALSTAYPHPKKNIKAEVMAEILSSKPISKKKNSATSRLIRWGSLAACILLVATVSLRMLPAIEKLEDNMVADNSFSSAEMDDGAVLYESDADKAVYEMSMERATEPRTGASTEGKPEASTEADMVENEHAPASEMTATEDKACEAFDSTVPLMSGGGVYDDRSCSGFAYDVRPALEEAAFAP